MVEWIESFVICAPRVRCWRVQMVFSLNLTLQPSGMVPELNPFAVKLILPLVDCVEFIWRGEIGDLIFGSRKYAWSANLEEQVGEFGSDWDQIRDVAQDRQGIRSWASQVSWSPRRWKGKQTVPAGFQQADDLWMALAKLLRNRKFDGAHHEELQMIFGDFSEAQGSSPDHLWLTYR